MFFINPRACEIQAVRSMLLLFGDATRLKCNFSKSSVTPIYCDGVGVGSILQGLECPVKPFPCQYLGMPISDSKLKKGELQPVCDKILGRMKGWKLTLLSLDGRLDLVKKVLSAMPIFQMIAIHMPTWLEKMIDKVRRGFLWERKEEATSGKCLVNWKRVCRPTELVA